MARPRSVRRSPDARGHRPEGLRARPGHPPRQARPEHRHAPERRRRHGGVRRGHELRPLLRPGCLQRDRRRRPAEAPGRAEDGQTPDESLLAASGADLPTWDGRWKAYVAGRPHESLSALFGLGGDHADQAKLRDLRDRNRLAELLMARQHAPEAVLELDRIELAGSPVAAEGWDRAMGDPGVRWLRARALEAASRQKEGEPLVEDPRQVLASYGPWWATRGRWARMRGDEPTAIASFIEAVSADPLLPEAACESIAPAPSACHPNPPLRGRKASPGPGRVRGGLGRAGAMTGGQGRPRQNPEMTSH